MRSFNIEVDEETADSKKNLLRSFRKCPKENAVRSAGDKEPMNGNINK